MTALNAGLGTSVKVNRFLCHVSLAITVRKGKMITLELHSQVSMHLLDPIGNFSALGERTTLILRKLLVSRVQLDPSVVLHKP